MSDNELEWTKDMHLGQRLTRYKAWANKRVLTYLLQIPEEVATVPRPTCFGSILHTLQHNYIVDDIFKAHLLGRSHGYSARRSENAPSLPVFRENVQAMDNWWIQMADQCDDKTLNQPITFKFLDGSNGEMSRIEMVMHVVNHTSYHRGFVDEILGQLGMNSPACDFPIYLRDMSAEGT